MRRILGLVFALGLLAFLPISARADEFGLNWTGPDGNGSITVTATDEGGGQYLITGIDGTQGGLALTLLTPETYGSNDNLFFPGGDSLVDNDGIAYTDGTNDYDIFYPEQAWLGLSGATPNTYYECSSATGSTCEGYAPVVGVALTGFEDPDPSTPEPSSVALLGLGLIGLLGLGLRRNRLTQVLSQS